VARLSSAKAPTAVRIRSRPQRTPVAICYRGSFIFWYTFGTLSEKGQGKFKQCCWERVQFITIRYLLAFWKKWLTVNTYFDTIKCIDDFSKRAISLTLPKTRQEYRSRYCFHFSATCSQKAKTKKIQCRLLHISENDDFTHLLKTAHTDTIDSVTVKEM
jgi:HipA-like protein